MARSHGSTSTSQIGRRTSMEAMAGCHTRRWTARPWKPWWDWKTMFGFLLGLGRPIFRGELLIFWGVLVMLKRWKQKQPVILSSWLILSLKSKGLFKTVVKMCGCQSQAFCLTKLPTSGVLLRLYYHTFLAQMVGLTPCIDPLLNWCSWIGIPE